jgi:surface antigen
MKAGRVDLPAAKPGKFWLAGISLLTFIGLYNQPAQAHTKNVHHHYAATTHHTVHSHRVTTTHRVTHEVTHRVAYSTYHHESYVHLASYRHYGVREHYRFHYIRYYRYHGMIHEAVAHYRHSWLQCVPYAREVSHIDLSGDAFLWWAEASGRYARGSTPMEGAVLNFRSIPRMPLGHVAVVTSVIDSRTIIVTQANWVPGTITNDVTVEDVSDDNDWSEVQVELGDGAKMGSPYPTYGFIYNQPDNGTIIAATPATQSNEVAEAPTTIPVATDAPDRNLQ